MQTGEQIYYQLIVLYHPSFDFDGLKGQDRTWKELFHHLLETDATFTENFTDEYLEQLRQERLQEIQEKMQRGPQFQRELNSNQMLQTASLEQLLVYNSIIDNPLGPIKSYLLRMLKLGL